MRVKMRQINYRKADISDIEILIEWRLAFLKEYFKNNDENENEKLIIEIRKYLNKALPEDNYIAWLAEIDNEIVGIGVMAVYYAPPKYSVPNGKIGYISNIYTLQKARKKGIAAFILDKLILEAKEKEIFYLHLHASEDGLNIYKRRGFEFIDNGYCLKMR
jgi:GNAT superfamily N-acetyltransferase